MAIMLLTARKGQAWCPPVPIYPVLDHSSSESENEIDFEVDSKGESELSMTQVVGSEPEDLKIPFVKVHGHRASKDEVEIDYTPEGPKMEILEPKDEENKI
jgi:hypothetical protein